MDNINLWEGISSKYILKEIFSYLKLQKSLEIIKINKKLRNIYDISLFHYQSYYFFTLFKNVKIETISDILESPYIDIFPEDAKYELIWRLIEKRKLFKNDDFYVIKNNKRNVLLTQKLMEKWKNKDLNYFFGGIEDEEDSHNVFVYHSNIREIEKIDKNIMNKILYTNDFLRYEMKEKYIKAVKYLNINLDNGDLGELSDLSCFINLEYLSISKGFRYNNAKYDKLILKLSETQIKNMKTIKINESKEIRNILNDIIITTNPDRNNDKIVFEKLEELHIKESLINKIIFNQTNLKKLNIVYDYRKISYSIEDLQNSINDIILKYLSLTHLNILFIYKEGETSFLYEFIPLMLKFHFVYIQFIENFSFNFYLLYPKNPFYVNKLKLKIKNIRNKKPNL